MDQSEFNTKLGEFFSDVATDGTNAAEKAIAMYFSNSGERFTGSQFENLINIDFPNSFTAEDFVSVQALSVDIPIRPAIWLLSANGQRECAALLQQVSAHATIWSDEGVQALSEDGPMWKLWNLLRVANWPEKRDGNGLGGQTKRSKLLAAKRPHLIPITDVVIRDAFPNVENYWLAFQNALRDSELRNEIAGRTQRAPEHVSLLRRIDAAIWTIATKNLVKKQQ